MRCRRAQTELQALLDGALSPNEEARLRNHLAACAPCRRLDSLRLVHEALSTQPKPEPSPDLAPAIMARARAQRGLARRPPLVPVWLEGWTLGSLALGLAACGLVISRQVAAAGLPEELGAQLAGLLPVALASAFGLLGVWYYRA